MKVLVVGAGGKTGRAVVAAAKQRGHDVTALLHSHSDDELPDVAVRTGDARDPVTMDAVVAGQEAVIDTVGGKTPYRATDLEMSIATAVIFAMQRHDVRRLVVTSMIGEGDSVANTPWYDRLLLATFLRGAKPDKADMESAVSASGLDWVITRPAILTDKPATGAVRVFDAGERALAHTITRDDLAAFLVDQLDRDDHVHHAVTIANR